MLQINWWLRNPLRQVLGVDHANCSGTQSNQERKELQNQEPPRHCICEQIAPIKHGKTKKLNK
jgi:hypothetical protein